MTEPSTARSPRPATLAAAGIAVLLVVLVLDRVFHLGVLETGVIVLALLPALAVVALPVLFYRWAKRRGDL